MPTLYIIRHAEAEGNHYRRVHGQYDSLVTPNGLKQIEALRGRFAHIQFDEIYCSDLYRTRLTASALTTKDGRPARPMKSLREIHLGAWEDKSWGELAVHDAEANHIFMHTPWLFDGRGGEAMAAVEERIYEAVRGIARTHEEGTVAVVSHGMAIRALMTRLNGLPSERMGEIPHCDNTAVGCVEWDGYGAPRVLFMGDNSHLGELSTLSRQHWWRKEGKQADVNLWFQPVLFPRDADLAFAFRRDAWLSVYGDARGFSEPITRAHSLRMAAAHPGAVVFAMKGLEPVGLLELDTEIVAPDNTGHISLVYLEDEQRGRALGAQLIGHAVSVYRALGRQALHLRVAESNASARRFYEKIGFSETGREGGLHGDLLVLQMPIRTPDPLESV